MLRVRSIVAAAVAAAAACLVETALGATPITVQDAVSFAQVGNPRSLDNQTDVDLVTFSPDRKKFFLVITRGDAASERYAAEIRLFDTAKALAGDEGQVIAQFASDSDYRTLGAARWTDDGRSIFFAASEDRGYANVYRYDVSDSKLVQVTHVSAQLENYLISGNGRTLVTLTRRERENPLTSPTCLRSGCRIVQSTLFTALGGFDPRDVSPELRVTDLVTGESRVIPEPAEDGAGYCYADYRVSLSGDGHYAARICRVLKAKPWWLGYKSDKDLVQRVANPGSLLFQNYLIDLRSGVTQPATPGPMPMDALSPDLVWVDHGRQLVLAVAHGDVSDPTLAAIAIDPQTGRVAKIAAFPATARGFFNARWSEEDSTLALSGTFDGMTTSVQSYRLLHGKWIRRAAGVSKPSCHGARIEKREGPNDRPVIVASACHGGAERVLLDANRWLDQKALGRTQVFAWKSKGGEDMRGLLTLPPGYEATRRYPLLIQTHGYDEKAFSLTGVSRNYILQLAAGRGIAVLQVAESPRAAATPQESFDAQDAYVGAVETLAQRGIVDADRVGIIGWSATATTSFHALVRSDLVFRAAALTDGAVWGTWTYLQFGGGQGFEPTLGGSPFGPGYATVLNNTSEGNVDRWVTPMMAISSAAVVNWELQAFAHRLGVPFENWQIPGMAHDVFRVSQRIAANQRLLDWFSFWLLDSTQGIAADEVSRWTPWKERVVTLKAQRPALTQWSASRKE